MTQVVTPTQMQAMDAYAITHMGIPGVVLMERAALGAVHVLHQHFSPSKSARIGILCGSGNNGGDGYAMARILAHQGFDVQLVAIQPVDRLQGDASIQANITHQLSIATLELDQQEHVYDKLAALPSCDIWVDALLGTGLKDLVRPPHHEAIKFLNTQPAVLAVDIPSGVDGATGQIMGICVHAHATATFAFPKVGVVLNPGRMHAGSIHIVDIGMPHIAIQKIGFFGTWLDQHWRLGKYPERARNTHKGNAGKVFLLAGSPTMAGAAMLSALGALHGGSGLVTVGTHTSIVPYISSSIHEVMACSVWDDTSCAYTTLHTHLERADVVGVGPGLGQSPAAMAALMYILNTHKGALVLDADALNMIAIDDTIRTALVQRASMLPCVLTPHPGEMARLCTCTTQEIISAPLAHCTRLAKQFNAIMTLKLATTLITSPDGRTAFNATGNAGMASPGMGDALTGIICAQLASRTHDPFEAVAMAVHAHGLAGDRAMNQFGQRGVTASRVLEALPWATLEEGAP